MGKDQRITAEQFADFMKELASYEGGVTDRDKASVGRTAFGITQRWYDANMASIGMPTKPVETLSESERLFYFKKFYFDKHGMDQLPKKLAKVVFDYGVNSGPEDAIKTLQSIIGAKEDGVVGPKTLQAINDYGSTEAADALISARWQHIKNLDNYQQNKGGWSRRLNTLSQGLKYGSD